MDVFFLNHHGCTVERMDNETQWTSKAVNFRFVIYPLHSDPQAAQAVRFFSKADNAVVESFLTSVFDGQQEILNGATEDMTQDQIEDIFADWAADTGSISIGDFKRWEETLRSNSTLWGSY